MSELKGGEGGKEKDPPRITEPTQLVGKIQLRVAVASRERGGKKEKKREKKARENIFSLLHPWKGAPDPQHSDEIVDLQRRGGGKGKGRTRDRDYPVIRRKEGRVERFLADLFLFPRQLCLPLRCRNVLGVKEGEEGEGKEPRPRSIELPASLLVMLEKEEGGKKKCLDVLTLT